MKLVPQLTAVIADIETAITTTTRCSAEGGKGECLGKDKHKFKRFVKHDLVKLLRRAKSTLAFAGSLGEDLIEDESPDGDDLGSEEPANYPEPRYGYEATPLQWQKPGVPIEAMSSVGSSFILRRLTEMVMSQKALDDLLEGFHGSLKWPNMSSAGPPPVKQYPWSSLVNQEAIDAITVFAEGDPPRLSASSLATLSQRMKTWGVVVVRNAVSREACARARDYLYKQIEDPNQIFGNVHAKKYRRDMPVNLTASRDTAGLFKGAVSTLAELYNEILGKDAVMVELSSLVSLPRTQSQNPHPDAGMDSIEDFDRSLVLSTFLSLDDVKDNQAALDVWPGSHTFYHFLSKANQKVILRMVSPVRMSVPAGTMVLMDSRLIHRGTTNRSKKPRPVLYWSLMSREGRPPDGPTYSILANYDKNLTLSQVLADSFPDEHTAGHVLAPMGHHSSHGDDEDDDEDDGNDEDPLYTKEKAKEEKLRQEKEQELQAQKQEEKQNAGKPQQKQDGEL